MIFYQDLESLVNKYFSEQMLQLNIPGAVFVLVKDGKLLLSKGYGFANLDKKIVVTPELWKLNLYYFNGLMIIVC